jgi:hypothetical protein
MGGGKKKKENLNFSQVIPLENMSLDLIQMRCHLGLQEGTHDVVAQAKLNSWHMT